MMRVHSIRGNDFKLDGGAMFGHAPKSLWKNWYLPDRFNRIGLASRSLYVRTDEHHLLCDTGIGNYLDAKLAKIYGVDVSEHRLIQNLKAIGVEETRIDFVILSHLHFDHAGGLIVKGSQPLQLHFPNAKYVVGRVHFERAANPHQRDRASFVKGLTDALQESGRLLLVDKETVDGLEKVVSFHYSQGHTPGKLHSLFQGAKEKVFFAGDLAPGVDWVNLPITMGYDRQPETLVDEKKKIFDRAINENWLMFYNHDHRIAASRISIHKNRYEAVQQLNRLADWACD